MRAYLSETEILALPQSRYWFVGLSKSSSGSNPAYRRFSVVKSSSPDFQRKRDQLLRCRMEPRRFVAELKLRGLWVYAIRLGGEVNYRIGYRNATVRGFFRSHNYYRSRRAGGAGW
jgi:hypothetical protein